MKLCVIQDEETVKNKKNQELKDINLSLPNSKIELMIENKLNLEKEEFLKKITVNENENKTLCNNPQKILEICLNSNLKIEEYNKDKVSYSNKNINPINNYTESKINFVNSNENLKKNNIENYDFLSISEIDFESEKDFKFIGFMKKKKIDLESDQDMGYLYKYNSEGENVLYIKNRKKFKIRLFLEINKLTCFNYMTDLNSKNGKFYPIINLDFDYISSKIYIDIENLTFRILTLGYDEIFTFSLQSKTAFQKIVNKINLIIKNSNGYKNNLLSVVKRKEFYKVIK